MPVVERMLRKPPLCVCGSPDLVARKTDANEVPTAPGSESTLIRFRRYVKCVRCDRRYVLRSLHDVKLLEFRLINGEDET
jgi:hypothetical protein